MKIRMIIGCVITCMAGAGSTALAGDEQVYLQADDFITHAFSGEQPEAQALWVQPALREELSARFGWRPGLRVRYWQQGQRTAWILDEVGKEKPITAGFVVENGLLEQVQVLAFRESRGWEIKYPFFTKQFVSITLADNDELSRQIDGITGATLSVRAMKRMARVALKLHEQTQATTLATNR